MKRLTPPTDQNGAPFAADAVFETCVSMVRDATLRKKLMAIRSTVMAESQDYATKATVGQLYKKAPHDKVGKVPADELVKVYTQRMVPKDSKGRVVYDRILSQPAHGRCPLCGIGTVNTLDHYLPKTSFPVFSVTPINLVPACTWCQGTKLEYRPKTDGGQLLHPYFDDLDGDIWLTAEVVPGTPAGFRFSANPPQHWSTADKKRVTTHLRQLRLSFLFSSNAGSRLAEIRLRLAKLFDDAGPMQGQSAVRAHLQEELVSIEAEQNNSWVAAMYRAAAASDWFCQGGFR